MKIAQEVIDRFLISKDLLGRIRFLPSADPDRLTLAAHILTAHDAAELALAGVARQLGRLPSSSKTYLMDYFPEIQKEHPTENVPGRDYFSQLNQVRIGIKHQGIFPDPKQWYRVGEITYGYVSTWSEKYLGISLSDLDESALISDPIVKQYFDVAKASLESKDYQKTLENLALAMHVLFQNNLAIRNVSIGSPHAEDAIKLSAFGVHANDFLALQEFLPSIYEIKDTVEIRWNQNKFGHPANWTNYAGEFCLKTFLNVALRIQDAKWIPGAIEFLQVYRHKITSLEDGVEIVQEQKRGILDLVEKVVIRSLRKGESIYGCIKEDKKFFLFEKEKKPVLTFMSFDEPFFGEIEKEKVRVTCVPIDDEFVRKYYPNLTEIDYDR